ncbi:hypothetical protein MNEG_6428, partial [Monoraphidium neglectum]
MQPALQRASNALLLSSRPLCRAAEWQCCSVTATRAFTAAAGAPSGSTRGACSTSGSDARHKAERWSDDSAASEEEGGAARPADAVKRRRVLGAVLREAQLAE